jgi:hypothetical protein
MAAKLAAAMSLQFAQPVLETDASDLPLNIAVRGDKVLILGHDNLDVPLSVEAARRSARRLLDAAAIAEGMVPGGAG